MRVCLLRGVVWLPTMDCNFVLGLNHNADLRRIATRRGNRYRRQDRPEEVGFDVHRKIDGLSLISTSHTLAGPLAE
jgi:hypothetical protein